MQCSTFSRGYRFPFDLTSRHILVQGYAKNERAGCHIRVHNSMNYCTEMIERAKMLEEEREGKKRRGDRQRERGEIGNEEVNSQYNTLPEIIRILGNGKATSLCEDRKKCVFLYYVCV